VTFFLVLFQHSPSGHFFGSLAIAPRTLRILLDMFVLALLLAANAAQMFSYGHRYTSLLRNFRQFYHDETAIFSQRRVRTIRWWGVGHPWELGGAKECELRPRPTAEHATAAKPGKPDPRHLRQEETESAAAEEIARRVSKNENPCRVGRAEERKGFLLVLDTQARRWPFPVFRVPAKTVDCGGTVSCATKLKRDNNL
jgi:hypothetical protein